VAAALNSGKDMVLDWNDGCTNDTSKTEPGACGCGKTNTGTDADTVPTANYECTEDMNNDMGTDSGSIMNCR